MSAMGGHQSAAAGTDVWLTPPDVLAALGGAEGFDLDPCAPVDRPWNMARQHYTIDDDGLVRPWHGRVWLNPPYSSSVIGRWMGRMAEHAHGFASVGSWVDEVMKVMQRAGDAVRLDHLYQALGDSPKAQRNRHWREKVRQTLQRGPFDPLGDGVWKVAEGRLL